MSLTDSAHTLLSKFEVLRDLESKVRQLMEGREQKRDHWYPSDIISPPPHTPPESWHRETRVLAAGSPDASRAALELNTLTEEGLPHFHRLLAVYLEDDSYWRIWNNLWTAEEDRHGVVLHDYARETRILDQRRFEEMQFEYLRAGFHPDWDRDPYRVFVYTTLQERATQFSHAETGKVAGEYEPAIAEVLANVARDEARHYTFYRNVFSEILERDPDQALHSASLMMPSIQMPGASMPGFKELADVIRRAGIYGPRDYLRIVQEQIRYWRIESITGLS